MEYITVEQFKEQPVEVQKVFLDWWKPTIGDLFAWNYSDEKENDLHKLQCCTSELVTNLTECNKGLKEGSRIPLLTEGQLRKFIEDKTNNKRLELVVNSITNEYKITLYKYFESMYDNKTYDYLGTDLLQAYWQVACLIAREEI